MLISQKIKNEVLKKHRAYVCSEFEGCRENDSIVFVKRLPDGSLSRVYVQNPDEVMDYKQYYDWIINQADLLLPKVHPQERKQTTDEQ